MSPVRTLGRPLRRSSAAVDRAMVRRETERTLARDPVIVYSMGKTGTTALETALAAESGRPVMKAHSLTRDGLDRRHAKATRLGVNDRPRFLWACDTIGDALATGGRWDLLCGVREPVALAVSDHFFGIQRQRETGQVPWLADDDHEGHLDAVVRNLEENFLDRDWFDDELLPTTGIDVYATPFDHHRGVARYTHDRFRVLLLRAEDLPEVGPTAVADFLYLAAPPTIERHNTGTADDPDSPYRRFVQRAALPATLVERVYATPMARHFYADHERARFLDRWTGALV